MSGIQKDLRRDVVLERTIMKFQIPIYKYQANSNNQCPKSQTEPHPVFHLWNPFVLESREVLCLAIVLWRLRFVTWLNQ